MTQIISPLFAFYVPLHVAQINCIMSGSPHSFGCGSLHKECGRKGEWSAVRLRRAHARGRRRGTYTVLMSADVRQEAVVTRGLCHLSCRKLWQVQIPGSRCTFGIKIFFFLFAYMCVRVRVCGCIIESTENPFAILMQSSLIQEEIGWSGYLYLSKCLPV